VGAGTEEDTPAREVTVRLSNRRCPNTIASVGNYAIAINWNDGHSTGIYSFDYMRDLGELNAARIVEDV
jgi:DUF971 family protein